MKDWLKFKIVVWIITGIIILMLVIAGLLYIASDDIESDYKKTASNRSSNNNSVYRLVHNEDGSLDLIVTNNSGVTQTVGNSSVTNSTPSVDIDGDVEEEQMLDPNEPFYRYNEGSDEWYYYPDGLYTEEPEQTEPPDTSNYNNIQPDFGDPDKGVRIAEAACWMAVNDGKIEFNTYRDVRSSNPNLKWDAYASARAKYIPTDKYWQSCDRAASMAIRESGVDVNFPYGGCSNIRKYLDGSDSWQCVGTADSVTLRPGDILLSSGHIKIYVGNEMAQKYWTGSTSNCYDASLGTNSGKYRPPCLSKMGNPSSKFKVYRAG